MIGAGGRKARPATLHGFVGTMENSRRWWQISHLRLDFHLCERLADLDAHHAAHYLGENDAVPQVPLHPLWLLGGWCLSVGPVQALQQVPLTPLLLGTLQLHHSDSCWEDVSSQLVKVHTVVTDLMEGQWLLLLHVRHLVGSSERTHWVLKVLHSRGILGDTNCIVENTHIGDRWPGFGS